MSDTARHAKTTEEDLVRLDDITDSTSARRQKLIELMENEVVKQIGQLASLGGDADKTKVTLDLMGAFQSLLVQEEKSAGDRAKIKLKHTETQLQDDANKLTTELLEKIALGTIQPKGDLAPLARPLENLDDALEDLKSEVAGGAKPIKQTELRDNPADLAD